MMTALVSRLATRTVSRSTTAYLKSQISPRLPQLISLDPRPRIPRNRTYSPKKDWLRAALTFIKPQRLIHATRLSPASAHSTSTLFFTWNPAVGKDCSGLWVGYYYCVGVPGTTTSAPTKTTATATEPTGSKNPTVLQKGLIKGYALFHQAGKGDTCAKIVSNLELLNMNAFYK